MKNFPNKDILEEFLSNCTPAEAYKTILEEKPFYSTTIEMLLAKKNKLINLAIAQITDDSELLYKFLIEGDLPLRVAVLNNDNSTLYSLTEDIRFLNSTKNDELVRSILFSGSDEELKAIMKNLYSIALDDLWEKNGILEDMNVSRWEKLLSFSKSNNNFNQGNGLLYRSTREFWSLFVKLRKNKLNRDTLEYLVCRIEGFLSPISSKSDLEFMEDIFSKWGDHINYFVTKKYADLNSVYNNNGLIKLSEHKDKYVRRGIYGYLDYSKLTREDIFKFYKRDKGDFVYEVIDNESIYFSYDNKSLNLRNAFYSCLFKDDSSSFIDSFHQKVEKFAVESGVYYPKGELISDSNYVLDENDNDLSIREHKEENLEENLQIQNNILNDINKANEAYEKLNKNFQYDRTKFLVQKYISSETLKLRSSSLLFKKIKKLEKKLQTQLDNQTVIERLIQNVGWGIGIIFIALLILIFFK